MRLFAPLQLAIALRYALSGRTHKFAFLVALMASLGMAVGVCALITVSAVMSGLQTRLKDAVLSTAAQAVVQVKDEHTIHFLLSLPEVTALMPYLSGQVLLQTPDGMQLADLTGYDLSALQGKSADAAPAPQSLGLPQPPKAGSYALIAPQLFLLEHGLSLGSNLRLISASNARYTPLGLTPTQRIFTVAGSAALPLPPGSAVTLIAALEDVRRLLRTKEQAVRLFLSDPFAIESVAQELTAAGLTFTDWRAQQGDFFKAVALEKLSMSVMLCLIIVTAAFNILSALTMLVSARTREIAVLKTLGCSRGFILQIFLLQGLICAAAGIALGVAAGIPLSLHAQEILSLMGISITTGELPVELNPGHIALIALSCLTLSALCTLYPALKAASCAPAAHLSAA